MREKTSSRLANKQIIVKFCVSVIFESRWLVLSDLLRSHELIGWKIYKIQLINTKHSRASRWTVSSLVLWTISVIREPPSGRNVLYNDIILILASIQSLSEIPCLLTFTLLTVILQTVVYLACNAPRKTVLCIFRENFTFQTSGFLISFMSSDITTLKILEQKSNWTNIVTS